jgi:alkanesulfonate monooxygenase SsuD/methylene tetrahydromethanopterin reductase-like flavin-dependent oxidoreductase (luciferase family)
VPYERRGARAEEFLRALLALWSEDVVEFAGDFYRIPPARMQPKPVQRPPAGAARRGRRDSAAAGGSARRRLDQRAAADLRHIDQPIVTIKQAAAETGRDPDALRFVCRGAGAAGIARRCRPQAAHRLGGAGPRRPG